MDALGLNSGAQRQSHESSHSPYCSVPFCRKVSVPKDLVKSYGGSAMSRSKLAPAIFSSNTKQSPRNILLRKLFGVPATSAHTRPSRYRAISFSSRSIVRLRGARFFLDFAG